MKNEWLKAIRPFGRSADLWGSANAVRAASVTFPLTPALSLRERENPPLAFSTTQRGVCPTNFPNNRTCRRLFPLPAGEGQGEHGFARRSNSRFLHAGFLSDGRR